MEGFSDPALFLVSAGLIGGVVLFLRGLVAYRHDRLISSVATSSLDAIAAGEVRVSGVVEAIDQTLISPLQSKPCVWYRARIEETGENSSRVILDEEKAQEFRVRSDGGTIRVVPRGARWEIDPAYDESTSLTGDDPPSLAWRRGPAYAAVLERDPETMSDIERQAAVEALLTVHRPSAADTGDSWGARGGGRSAGLSLGTSGLRLGATGLSLGTSGLRLGATGLSLGTSQGRRYREARLEPGATVTILGQALPWGDVREALYRWDPSQNVEMTMADDIAAAREMGLLAATPEEAWGNAAIPGFGIGRPTVAPELDPRAHQPEPTGEAAHEEALARYDIPDEELVISRGIRGGMAIYEGSPEFATTHHDFTFVLGVVGAVMAVLCALGLGAVLTGTL